VIYSVQLFEKAKISAIDEEFASMQEAAKKFNSFLRGSSILMSPTRNNSSGNPLDLLADYIRMALHLDIIKFNQMYREVLANKEYLDKIITIIGRLETEISVACYRESVKDHYVIPSFDENAGYEAKGITHPLIEGCVENDVNTKRGLLITGSNASGKSTYLKSCAINAILAQTIHTVLGKEYRAPFFRIFSSMALTDDIFEGDSYYIVEIKSIKKILDAAKKDGAKVLCFVDEVLRGTNTIERIAASTEILKSFAGSKVLCFAATHDIELTSLLSDKFDLCHFEGHVSDNDVHFDYLVKEGPATNRNAISLLGLLGYDENIVDNAQNLANKFIATGHWD
jgi:DNA mismatch repair ATPase MutS